MLQSNAMLLVGALALATVSLGPVYARDVTFHSIVSDPAGFDHRDVVLLGSIANVRANKTSHAGYAYTTFELNDASGNGIGIFMWGHPDLTDGEHVRVNGEFKDEYRVGRHSFHNEIDASSVVPWQ